MRVSFLRLDRSRWGFMLSGMVKTSRINVQTRGNCHIVDITADVASAVTDSGLVNGAVVLFNTGSTAGITTLEYEPGLVNYDIADLFERIAPANMRYEHEETWHDDRIVALLSWDPRSLFRLSTANLLWGHGSRSY